MVREIPKLSGSVINLCFVLCVEHPVAEKVVSKSHIYKKNELKVKWVEEEVSLSDIEGSDSEDEPNQIEVHNVPETVKEDVMTAYFETEKSSGSRGAVSGCEKMDNGVFIVTFYDPKGMHNALFL